MENKKSYYAIIPANVRYNKNLTPNAKILYGEITALCNEKGFCWATNDYFAELYEVSKTSISKWINQLVKYEYINLTLQYKEGTKQILHRYLRIVKDPIEEKLNTPIEEKLKENNTLDNNTGNNTNNIYIDKSKKEKNESKNFIKPTIKEISEYCKERKNNIDSEQFFDFYESKGWLIGKNKMKDWKAAIRTWERNNKNKQKESETCQSNFGAYRYL